MIDMRCRLITIEDSEAILTWRNDLETRKMSINADKILPFEHSRWFADMLENECHIGIVGEINSEKIGVTFMKIHEGTSTVSINLNPLHRGKRLGGMFLRNSMLKMHNLYPNLRQFSAEIKDSNAASIKIFTQNGFKLHSQRDGSSIYRFDSQSLGVKRDA